MNIVGRFSWHKNPGDFAESWLRRNHFRSLGLNFRKIRTDRIGKKPDGFILRQGEKIALAEIKLILRKTRSHGVQRITIDQTIRNAICSARKQLEAIHFEGPKIIYLIKDDEFFSEEMLRWAIFGKKTRTETTQGKVVFNGYSGFHPNKSKYGMNNQFRDGLISAVICYGSTTDGYKLWVYENKTAKALPHILLDRNHLEELWEYSSTKLKRKI